MIWVPYKAGIFFSSFSSCSWSSPTQDLLPDDRIYCPSPAAQGFCSLGQTREEDLGRAWCPTCVKLMQSLPCSDCSSFPTGLYHKRNFLRTCMLPQSFIRTHGKVLGEEPIRECGLPVYLWLPEVFLNSHTGLHLAFSNSLKPRTEFLPDWWCPGMESVSNKQVYLCYISLEAPGFPKIKIN